MSDYSKMAAEEHFCLMDELAMCGANEGWEEVMVERIMKRLSDPVHRNAILRIMFPDFLVLGVKEDGSPSMVRRAK